MSGRMITIDKLTLVRLVGIRETWHRLFAKCQLKVAAYKVTHVCRDDQLYAVLKAGINGVIRGVQYIWEVNPTKEKWVFFYLLTRITRLTISIKLEWCGRSAIYGHLELVLFLTAIVTTPL